MCRYVHDTMDVESVESRFSDMSLSPFGGHGNYAHSDGQMSGSPYKANGNPPYAMLGSRDSWGAQRGFERPLSGHTRPSECLIYYLPHLSCIGVHPIAAVGLVQPSVGTQEPSRLWQPQEAKWVHTCVGHVFMHHPSKVPHSSCLWASCQGMPGIHMPVADSREHAQ